MDPAVFTVSSAIRIIFMHIYSTYNNNETNERWQIINIKIFVLFIVIWNIHMQKELHTCSDFFRFAYVFQYKHLYAYLQYM